MPHVAAASTLLILALSLAHSSVRADDAVTRERKQHEDAVGRVRDSIFEDFRNRRFDKLLPLLRAAAKDKPENAEVHYKLASVLYLVGNTQEAVAESEKAVRLNDKVAHYHELHGRVLLATGNIDFGIDELNKAIRIDKQNHRAYCALGDVYLAQLEYSESIENFSSALAIRETVRARIGRAAAEYRSGKHTEAIEDCDAVLLKEPNNHEAVAFRAFAKLFIEESTGIREDAEQALKTGDKYASLAHYALGSVCSLERNYVAAIKHLDNGIALAPNEPLFYYGRGRVHLRKGDFNRGIEDLEMSTKVAGDDERLNKILGGKAWEVYKCRAAANFFFKQNYTEAIKDATQAIELNATDADCYVIRAWARMPSADSKFQIDDLDKAISIAPDHVLALSLLAETLVTTHDDALRDGCRAKQLATKACELTEYKNPHCVRALASACAQLGEFTNACKWQSQVVDQLAHGPPDKSATITINWAIPMDLDLQSDEHKKEASDRLDVYRQGRPLVLARNAMRSVDNLLDIVPR
jgi:tetratricopeptide (TPR) repeat protein